MLGHLGRESLFINGQDHWFCHVSSCCEISGMCWFCPSPSVQQKSIDIILSLGLQPYPQARWLDPPGHPPQAGMKTQVGEQKSTSSPTNDRATSCDCPQRTPKSWTPSRRKGPHWFHWFQPVSTPVMVGFLVDAVSP